MIILGIETSCDESAVSLLQIEERNSLPHVHILGNELISQIDIHAQYGGVFPMMAKREHAKNLVPLLDRLLKKTNLSGDEQKLSPENRDKILTILQREPELAAALIPFLEKTPRPKIDLISVTSGPGLEPALWVGLSFAQALSLVWDIPIHAANHMEGHIVSATLQDASFTSSVALRTIQFPALALLISGGHTELIHVSNFGSYKLLGQTRDDAVGEAFDKVARILGLPYPGGPEISKLAKIARDANLDKEKYSIPKLPRPMIHSGDLDFSFAGLKTAVLYLVQELKKTAPLTQEQKQVIACEFEDAVTEVLTTKTSEALDEIGAAELIIGGGVIANTHIRNAFEKLCVERNILLHLPHKELTTDNALMIALAGYFHKDSAKMYHAELGEKIIAQGNLRISQ